MGITKISILLIKSDISENNIVKEGVNHTTLNNCEFYYKNSVQNRPTWVGTFFNNELGVQVDLRTTSAQGVLIVKRSISGIERFFAVCFGYGRYLLNQNVIEERFGMITALNSIDEESIRSLDVNCLEAIPKNSRIQSSKLSGIPNFNIDIEKDLLKTITGKSNKDFLGQYIYGSDSLSTSMNVDINSIGVVLDKCYETYNNDSYKRNFSWIDHIALIKDTSLVKTLDEKLLEKINNFQESTENIWMAIPEIIDWENTYEIILKSKGETYDDIDISSVLSEVYNSENIPTIDGLKKKTARVLNEQKIEVNSWSYYKCLCAEIEIDNEIYLINSGKWYKVNRDYVNIINNYYDQISISDIDIIEYNHDNEGDYNSEAANSSEKFALLDKKLVATGVARNKIEFCDLFSKGKEILHVKRYGGSSVLSHLFNQGLVSGELCLDKKFRERLNEKLEEDWKINEPRFTPNDYKIIFCIISKGTSLRPKIPFFSKITLKHVATTLQNYGYNVLLKKISDNSMEESSCS